MEAARNYLNRLNRPYEEEDLLIIAKLQMELEEKCLSVKNVSLVICDTNLLVIKIWSIHKYQRCHPWIEEELKKNLYHQYLLTNIDLPWEDDPLREHPESRQLLFDRYQKDLIDMKANYEIVSGQGEQRFLKTLKLLSY